MFIFLLIIIACIYFYLKKKPLKIIDVEKTEAKVKIIKESTVDEQILKWSEKNKISSKIAKKEITEIAPVINPNGLNFLSVCKSCLSLYSIEDSAISCPCCTSQDIIMYDKGKIYSGRWSILTESWALTKESAHPIMVINKISN